MGFCIAGYIIVTILSTLMYWKIDKEGSAISGFGLGVIWPISIPVYVIPLLFDFINNQLQKVKDWVNR